MSTEEQSAEGQSAKRQAQGALGSLAAYLLALRSFLAGHKTYVVAGAGLAYSLGISRGWWPHDASIDIALGSTGAITLRAAVTRLTTQFLDDLTRASATPAVDAPVSFPQQPTKTP